LRPVAAGMPGNPRILVADYVAFDLETTGLSSETDEILEVAMVRFAGGEPVARWSSLVNPGRPVPLKTLRLTHIDPSELPGSPALSDLVPRIQEFRKDLPLVGHNSGFDALFLAKHVDGFPGVPLYDTLELSRIAVPGFRSYKLADIAREMDVAVSEAHRAYDDAEVSGVLFRLIQVAIAAMPERIRRVVREVMGKDWAAARLFTVAFDAPAPQGLAPSAVQASAQQPLFAEPAVMEGRPAPPSRPPEIEGTPEVADSLRRRVTELLAGGEKVTAVNVPLSSDTAAAAARAAQEYAHKQGKRVLLLGFPEECLPEGLVRTGSPQDFACLARLWEASAQAERNAYAGVDLEQRRFLAALFRWAELSEGGAFAEVQMGSAGYEVRPEVSCPTAMECRRYCSRAGDCFYLLNEARTRYPSLGQGLACFASLHSGFAMVTPYDLALVWASHDLARAWQGQEPRTDLSRLRDIAKQAGLLGRVPSLTPLQSAAHTDLGRGGLASHETVSLAARVTEELAAASLVLREERQASLPDRRPDRVDPPMLWKDLHFLEAYVADFRRFTGSGGGSGVEDAQGGVPLVEQSYGEDGGKGAVLVRRVVWPASTGLRAISQATGARLVLLSDLHSPAFRSNGGRRAVGLDLTMVDPVDLSVTGAPGFGVTAPLARESVLLATLDGVAVSPQAYPQYLKGLLVRLASEVKKGLLVTFPSRALLKDTYSLVQPILEEAGIAVYGQGIDGGHRVVEHLEEDEAMVLALAGSGPIAGDPVPKCLVLARVPFAPPNPLDELRRAQVSSTGGDGFVEVNVRPPAISLRAHVERMLRSGHRCAIVLADPKVLPRRSNWGREFMAAFDDLRGLVCPERELVARVSAHLRG